MFYYYLNIITEVFLDGIETLPKKETKTKLEFIQNQTKIRLAQVRGAKMCREIGQELENISIDGDDFDSTNKRRGETQRPPDGMA